MTTEPSLRKQFGMHCENQIDKWFATNGWVKIVANKTFRGGEIDRVYSQKHKKNIRICLVEVKGIKVLHLSQALSVTSEWGLKRIIKKKQIQNLQKKYLIWTKNLTIQSEIKYYFRLMVVLVFQNRNRISPTVNELKKWGFKFFIMDFETIIISIEPEFVNGQTFGLQISEKS